MNWDSEEVSDAESEDEADEKPTHLRASLKCSFANPRLSLYGSSKELFQATATPSITFLGIPITYYRLCRKTQQAVASLFGHPSLSLCYIVSQGSLSTSPAWIQHQGTDLSLASRAGAQLPHELTLMARTL